MFMASKKPAFTELQPNETLPLDFNKVGFDEQVQNMNADLDKSLSSNQELFEGIDIQPHSDNPGTDISTESYDDLEESSDSDDLLSLANLAAARSGKDHKKPRSPYRRGQFKFKKSEPNRIQV